MTKLKTRQTIDNNVCEGNPVAEQYSLGQRLGVNGTPAIILEDGTVLPGYMPPAALAQRLEL